MPTCRGIGIQERHALGAEINSEIRLLPKHRSRHRDSPEKAAQMFERLNTPEEAYNYRLGSALKMERTVLEILEVNVKNAESGLVVEFLSSHLEESRSHVPTVESAFSLLGWEIDDSQCPVIDAFEKQVETHIKKAEATIIDAIILQDVVEIEHYEIGVYENLIAGARAMHRHDVAELLQRNIESEQAALRKASRSP